MEFKKVEEMNYNGRAFARDYITEEDVFARDLAQRLIAAGVHVNSVFVREEDVELDAKTIEGRYSVQDIVVHYEEFLSAGERLAFVFDLSQGEKLIEITTFNDGYSFNLFSEADLGLNDLLANV